MPAIPSTPYRRRAWAYQSGTAAVEFAILLLPMLLLAFGVVEYGRAIYNYNTLVKSVRASARLLSSQSPDNDGYAGLQEDARCLAVHGNVDCTVLRWCLICQSHRSRSVTARPGAIARVPIRIAIAVSPPGKGQYISSQYAYRAINFRSLVCLW